MASMEIIGHIGDVQLRTSPGSQKQYLRLSVAVDEPGEKEATWFSCIVTGKAVETPDNLLKVFRKGRLVRISGRPKLKGYLKSDGTAGSSNTILVDGLPMVLDPKPKDY